MLFTRLLLVSTALASVVACAEKEAPRGATPEPQDPIVAEVRERCSSFAARLCASAAECCESSGDAFSRELCASSFTSEFCGPASQVVGEGIATYHPEAEEPCLAAWARAHETCVADWEEIIALRQDVWSACKMVQGTVEPGRGCSSSSACAQPEGPATARCLPDPTTRQPTCQVLEILGQGAECPYPLGDVSVCDVGFYCTATERGTLGTCDPITADGQECDTSIPINQECGLGSYCGLDDGVCHRATNFGGPSCAQSTECVSFTCTRSSSGGTCTEALSTAADLCERGAPR
ncbi:MAG TPA: hypothetical protein VF103_05690 [Polyangiaceae bacterium]